MQTEGEVSAPAQDDTALPATMRARLRARAAWARARAEDSQRRLDAERAKHRSVDFTVAVFEHDRNTSGRVLAGALAFRLFLWILPACLVVVGVLGFFDGPVNKQSASLSGLGKFTASTIEEASKDAHRARWLLIATGCVALYSASVTLAKLLWVATALAWQMPPVKMRRKPQAAAVVVGVLVFALAAMSAARWLREQSFAIGLITTMLLIVVWAAVGWAILLALPRPPHVPPRGLLPGAIVIGVGVQVLHLVTTYYLANQLTSTSKLYGALGSAATLLLWSYLVARLLIAASLVNKTWEAGGKAQEASDVPVRGGG